MTQNGATINPMELAAPAQAPSFSIRQPLPSVLSPFARAAILERLSFASRRGRLAGFQAGPGPSEFRATLFSEPFDHELHARIDEIPDGGSVIRFTARMLPKVPVIFAVVLVATVWPGVILTDKMIPGEWGWIDTWMWYIPLTALPLPWLWIKWMKKCRAAAGVSAYELLHKLAGELEGKVGDPPAAPASVPRA
ncbi:MAG: hypothetical protein IT436_09870 [Phycisphaerales bacterium]|nr:hypothetical protein [Phycisphaerales bacterium]